MGYMGSHAELSAPIWTCKASNKARRVFLGCVAPIAGTLWIRGQSLGGRAFACGDYACHVRTSNGLEAMEVARNKFVG